MEFDGKDLEEALAAAAAALGRPAGEMDYELLEGGRKGVFGLGARPVRIRVARDGSPTSISTESAATPLITTVSAASAPAAALADILRRMGFDLSIDESRRQEALELTLDGADRERLAARDGELLASLEFVLNRMGRRMWPAEPSVHLVCPGLRKERDGDLLALVRQAAAEVVDSGRPRRLREMNPYERRIVHVTVREFEGLTTVSEGSGFLKRVRIEKIAP